MTLKNILIATFFLSNTVYAENSIGIDINRNDVEALASINVNALADYANGTTYILDANYLRSDGNNMTRIGFSGQNRLQGIEGLTLAFGLKGVFASNFLAFPLMAKATYALPLKDSIPNTSLSISLAYAPSVLSFRDADNYSDFRLEADMEIISNIHLFTGYRNISTNHNHYDQTFNNSFYGGLKLSF